MKTTIQDLQKLSDDLSLDDLIMVGKPGDHKLRTTTLRKVWELFWTSFYVLDRPTRPDPQGKNNSDQ